MASASLRHVQRQGHEAENYVADQNEEMITGFFSARMRADGTQHEPLQVWLDADGRSVSNINTQIVQQFNSFSDGLENNPDFAAFVDMVMQQGLQGLEAIFFSLITDGIRWSKIILLIFLAYKLCRKVLSIAEIRLIINKLLIFLRNHAGQWISNSGGWAAIVHSPITPLLVFTAIGAGIMYLYHKYRSRSTPRAIAY